MVLCSDCWFNYFNSERIHCVWQVEEKGEIDIYEARKHGHES